MLIESLYNALYKLLESTSNLVEYISINLKDSKIVIPNHLEIPSDSIGKFRATMLRFKFKEHEEPYETFSWPGFVHNTDMNGLLQDLIIKANDARDDFSCELALFKSSKSSTSKPVIALCEYHRSLGGHLPIIGSPDRIKIRQLTRHIRSFHNATRVTFSHDVKNEITSFDPSALIEQFHSTGFKDQAIELSQYKEGELKKVHPPTERWRANVHFSSPMPVKVHAAMPVFFTGSKPDLRGITSGDIPEKKTRAPRSNKKTLIPVIEQYGVYRYE